MKTYLLRTRDLALQVACFLAFPLLAAAQSNAGEIPSDATIPFAMASIATFDEPWAIAFLLDGQMLITEKAGRLLISTQNGYTREVVGAPLVDGNGQNGLLDVAVSPNFPGDGRIYLSFVEPGEDGSGLALAHARLEGAGGRTPRLVNFEVIWRQEPKGAGNQPGGIIAFSPDGNSIFLTSGDRRRPDTAQDLDIALGKVLRLNRDGLAPDDNPMGGKGGVRAQIWTSGHRNPYGLAFAPDGRLWLHEMGPRGGDELNLIQSGQNYGWPVVSNGDNYEGTRIPRHATRPEFAPPALFWTPVIAPAGMTFYSGMLFPEWQGSALIGALSGTGLVRIAFHADGNPSQVNRWDLGNRIRDVAVAADGAVWIIEDSSEGRLLRLSPIDD